MPLSNLFHYVVVQKGGPIRAQRGGRRDNNTVFGAEFPDFGLVARALGDGERRLVGEYHERVRVKFNLIDSGDHSGFFEKSLKIWH
jgi:hypothetical protein